MPNIAKFATVIRAEHRCYAKTFDPVCVNNESTDGWEFTNPSRHVLRNQSKCPVCGEILPKPDALRAALADLL